MTALLIAIALQALPSPGGALDYTPRSLMPLLGPVQTNECNNIFTDAEIQQMVDEVYRIRQQRRAEMVAMATNPADVPVLLDARPAHDNKIDVSWTHPSAYDFTVRSVSDGTTHTIDTHHAGAKAQRQHTFAAKIQIFGRLNEISVAVRGTTNWSNVITVIP